MWKLKVAKDGPWLTTTNNHIGRQHWEFDPDAGTPEERAEVEKARERFKKHRFQQKQSSDLLMRLQLRKKNESVVIPAAVRLKVTEGISEEGVTTTLRRAITFFSSIQAHDGHWPNESAGPLYFIAPMVMTLHVIGKLNSVLSSEHQKEILRYLYNHQNEDGGWGFHIEGPSTMLGSALNYICLRLLGEGPDDGDDNAMSRGREWILDHGGLVSIPTWGKFFVAVIGLYDWDGCNPLLPELWLVPNSFPLNPGTLTHLCRLVYMPMSYVYGKRFVGPVTELIISLRLELYNETYESIKWGRARNNVAKEDLHYPHPLIQDLVWGSLYYFYEPLSTHWPFSLLREKAMKIAMRHVHYNDENSRYLTHGCIDKMISLIACWVENPNSDVLIRHLARFPDYYWIAEDGMKVQTFGSQMWDAGLAIQAIISCNLHEEYQETLRKAHDFIKASQVRENPSGDFKAMYRHISKGAWTFSTADHGWQVSDCTAEGLKACLLLSQISPALVGDKMETERLYDSVNIILSLQGENGGFSVWEPRKAPRWMENFNPTEIFKNVVTETEYMECTASAIQSLVMFRKLHPNHRQAEIDRSISKGIRYIEATQNSDGSWYSYWGICYTYGTLFAIDALDACGRTYDKCPILRKSCQFLLSKQLSNGGWGESYLSNTKEVYTNLPGDRSNLVNTAWALLGLIKAGQADIDPTPIHQGIRVLINAQMEDGDFPQQEVTGIFFKTCPLHYASYRNIFPIWLLANIVVAFYLHEHKRKNKRTWIDLFRFSMCGICLSIDF